MNGAQIMQESFEKWYGFSVCDDMDIQTSVAWENWQAAWIAAVAACVERVGRLRFAIDNAGNKYRRPADADHAFAAMRCLTPNAALSGLMAAREIQMSDETECGQQVRSNDQLGVTADADPMRFVYMTKAQREAYGRIAKDAERYRWLRDQPWGELFYYDSDGEHRKHFCNSISAGNQLGAAIDAAMLLTPNTGLSGRGPGDNNTDAD